MENIYYSSGDSYDTFLGIKIVDLEDKPYESFRISIDNNEWQYTTIDPTNISQTNVITFNNLNHFTTYKFSAQYKISDIWFDIQDCTFQTMNPTPDNSMPILLNGQVNASGTAKPINDNFPIGEAILWQP